MRKRDLQGLTFGKLTVTGPAPGMFDGKNWRVMWRVQCSCGTPERVIASTVLTSGRVNSCGGCARGAPMEKHGLSHSTEYRSWISAKSRCFNKNNPEYASYGGRGITMCDEWRRSFKAFLAYMGPKASPDLSIERENNDGHYQPGNCHWADDPEQARNKRSTRLVSYQGRTMCRADLVKLARHSSITFSALSHRLDAGWPIETALSRPVRKTILTQEEAQEIWDRRQRGENVKALAARFGLSPVSIYAICNGRSWPSLDRTPHFIWFRGMRIPAPGFPRIRIRPEICNQLQRSA